jgi:hypothetical protein
METIIINIPIITACNEKYMDFQLSWMGYAEFYWVCFFKTGPKLKIDHIIPHAFSLLIRKITFRIANAIQFFRGKMAYWSEQFQSANVELN